MGWWVVSGSGKGVQNNDGLVTGQSKVASKP